MVEFPKTVLIAIDGPAGAGKSTVAKGLGQKLGFGYLDSGAYYRCYALKALQTESEPSDESAMRRLVNSTELKVQYQSDGSPVYLLDDLDVTQSIRSQQVTRLVSPVSQSPSVRDAVNRALRETAAAGRFLIDGRDIGSVVFPDASLKFYLTASSEVRALRRQKELLERGEQVELKALQMEIEARDHQDSVRPIAPLMRAADAVLIDSSAMSLQEVIQSMVEFVEKAHQRGSIR